MLARHTLLLVPLCAATLGCKAVISGSGGGGGGGGGDTAAPAPSIDGPDWIPGDTGDTGEEVKPNDPIVPIQYDCDELADEFTEIREVEGARGYHGLVFDSQDRIVGWDMRNAIIAATYEGDSEVFVPGIDSVEQMISDEDGNIYYIDSWEGAVFKIYPSGGTELVAAGFDYSYPYGLFWGPDGNLYIVDGRVVRLDMQTFEVTELLVPPNDRWIAHAANFSIDSTSLFVSTVGSGDVIRLPLDEELNPAGDFEVFANLPGGWQDSVGVDACGNLYIAEYYTSSLFRVSPDGSDVQVLDGREREYGHAVVWGSGEGGWRADAIYMPKPYDGAKVKEVVVGVPNGDEVRTWNGVRVGR